ncbi:hypothetical protein ATKI12_3040 [Kitasatospora sp. Ki12]
MRTRGRTGARSLARRPALGGVSKVFWSDQSSEVFPSCAVPQPRVAPGRGPGPTGRPGRQAPGDRPVLRRRSLPWGAAGTLEDHRVQ